MHAQNVCKNLIAPKSRSCQKKCFCSGGSSDQKSYCVNGIDFLMILLKSAFSEQHENWAFQNRNETKTRVH